jgi:transposase InsO family protein
VSIGRIEEYLETKRWEYLTASKREKGRILDEVCEALQYHRKAAIRTLRQQPGQERKRSGRPRLYDGEVIGALRQVWEASDQLCGKRLAPFLSTLVPVLENCGELTVTGPVRAQLLRLSAATIDRRLQPYRLARGRRPYRPSPAADSVKARVPIRTFGDWAGVQPGSLQGDLVLHCGSSVAGFYLTTLLTVDVATGWTECEPIHGLGQQRIAAGLEMIRRRLPMPLREFHSDNGSEFLNGLLVSYCRRQGITLSRGRPYKKNDQAYAEQKNWLVVRRFVGYDRYSSDAALALLGELYQWLRLYLNFFQPIRKLVHKERVGSKLRKVYDDAATPYQRVLASGVLTEDEAVRLRRVALLLNPVQLRRKLDDVLRQLGQHHELPATARRLVNLGRAEALGLEPPRPTVTGL